MVYPAKILLFFWAAALFLCGCRTEKKIEQKMEKTSAEAAVIIDVRSAEEYRSGYIKGAINIPHTEIAEKITAAVPGKSTRLKLYCRSGRRVKIAMKELQKLGYKNLKDLGGLDDACQQLALPVVK